MMDSGDKHRSAAWRRKDQVDAWNASDTAGMPANRETASSKVNFDKGTVFLAACSQSDFREVEELLNQGVNPDSCNIDGLTALHQAAIDDNLPMVEFLLSHGANVNVQDNEAWTPLHATASCSYMDIAECLVVNGAGLDLVNSDGDLPLDIAEGDDMEQLLANAMRQRNIDAEDARGAEEQSMLIDAQKWLNNKHLPELEHPKTGATALIIAAAKGYHRVLSVLIEAGACLDHQDADGWTAVHAAAHWGQEEALKILALANASLDISDDSGQLPSDVAEPSVQKLIKELQLKQQESGPLAPSVKMREKAREGEIITNPSNKGRRTSITRISNSQKDEMMHNDALGEKAVLSGSGRVGFLDSKSDDNTNKNDSEKEVAEKAPSSKPNQAIVNVKAEVKQPHVKMETNTEEPVRKRASQDDTTEATQLVTLRLKPVRQHESETRSNSLPPRLTHERSELNRLNSDQNSFRMKLQAFKRASASDPSPPIVDTMAPAAEKPAQAPAEAAGGDGSRRAFAQLKQQGTAGTSAATYVPYYKRKQMERENKEREAAAARENAASKSAEVTPIPATAPASNSITVAKAGGDDKQVSFRPERKEPTTPTTPQSGDESSTATTPTERRSSKFGQPKRDEEAETQRKMKAKRARETRRSTQGVTQDDVKAAEATLKSAERPSDLSNIGSTATLTAAAVSTATTTATTTTTSSGAPEETGRRRAWQRSFSHDVTPSPTSPGTFRATNNPLYSPRAQEDGSRSSFRKARDVISGVAANDPPTTSSSYVSRYSGRERPERPESTVEETARPRYSWRERAAEIEKSASQNHREEAAAVSSTDAANNQTEDGDRRTSRNLRNRKQRRERRSTGVINFDESNANDEKDMDDEKEQDTTEEKNNNLAPNVSAATSDAATEPPTNGWSSRYSTRRYGSTSDVPNQMASGTTSTDSTRPYRSSYRSRPHSSALEGTTTSDQADYKKLYEDAKKQCEEYKSQVDSLKKELSDKEQSMRSNGPSDSISEKRELRNLQRRVSELEEEVKSVDALKQDNTRLKEENGALIRVISKLSK